LGKLTALLGGFKGLTSKGEEGRGKEERKGLRGRGKRQRKGKWRREGVDIYLGPTLVYATPLLQHQARLDLSLIQPCGHPAIRESILISLNVLMCKFLN